MSNSYLKKRRKGYYVRVPVPKSAQAAVGQKEITRTLSTQSLTEAKQKRHKVIADIYGEINALAQQKEKDEGQDVSSVPGLVYHLRGLLRQQTRGEFDDDPELLGELAGVLLDQHLGSRKGREHTTKELNIISNAMAMDGSLLLLSDAFKSYMETIEGKIIPRTIKEKQRTFDMFLEWGGDMLVKDVNRSVIVKFMDEVLIKNDRENKTITKYLSHLGTVWSSYLIPRGEADYNPTAGISRSLPKAHRGKKETSRRPWEPAEIQRFLSGIRELPAQRDLELIVLLVLYTGFRRSEIFNVKLADVHPEGIEITEGKTNAAVRMVPTHTIIKPLVEYLKATAKDEYLLPTRRRGKDAEDALGKRFGRYRRILGSDNAAINIHTLRHSFISNSENSQVPEHLTKILTGHSRGSLTYGHYSPANAVNWKLLDDSMQKVSHGELVDNAVREAIERILNQ